MDRSAARSTLAFAEDLPNNDSYLLLQSACRLSLHPENDPSEFEAALITYGTTAEPLWPALARHLARRSTAEDRALLVDLAMHPEKREPPLSWGLQYIVRGDVVVDDPDFPETGRTYRLEEFGLGDLPYLEDMPPELEVDWEA